MKPKIVIALLIELKGVKSFDKVLAANISCKVKLRSHNRYICSVSFLYPLFLLAGFTIAVPILIHLFNLRRYKTVFFSNTRFLKNIQLRSQKQSEVRYKWLLALRILFLLTLVLAFAKPFFPNKENKNSGNRLQVIYVDNSGSMSVKKGARSVFELAKEVARKQLQKANPNDKFLLLSNNPSISFQPITAEKAIAALHEMDYSATNKSADKILNTVQSLVQSEAAEGADVYYYSDFQQQSFPQMQDAALMKGIRFYGVPIRVNEMSNVYIDTAMLTSPNLQVAQSNKLVVHTKLTGDAPKESLVLQLSINGQVKSAASIRFDDKKESSDTLSFQVSKAGWQQILITVNDANVKFDDSFRITARSSSNLSILVLNQTQPNPYLQAAFQSYEGFQLKQENIGSATEWKDYNLIVLNALTQMNEALSKKINDALNNGQSICVFPGKMADINSINSGLSKITDLQITAVDTANQQASALQEGSDLVKNIFERIPENVQLPSSSWHYVLEAGLATNQQSILSFRNGNLLLAQYSPTRGKLYFLTTAADITSGNFQSSYFFVPFLYQMAAQSRGSDVFAVTSGKQTPVYLPLNNADERNMLHLYGNGIDIIPSQKPSGSGLDVFLGQSVQQPGFYTLTSSSKDSIAIAVNQDNTESQLDLWDMATLRKNWNGKDIHWMELDGTTHLTTETTAAFPLWKVCVILALIMLAAETYLLAAGLRKQTVAPR